LEEGLPVSSSKQQKQFFFLEFSSNFVSSKKFFAFREMFRSCVLEVILINESELRMKYCISCRSVSEGAGTMGNILRVDVAIKKTIC
jgi:hypothetical protein